MKLELRKFTIKKNITVALLCNFFVLGFVCLIFFVEGQQSNLVFNNYDEIVLLAGSFINVIYIIFAGVLISKYIVEEYKSKTIYLMFTYPLRRKKLIMAKVLIICLFTFCLTLLSYFIVLPIFYCIMVLTNTTLGEINSQVILLLSTKALIAAIVNAMVGLIPLYVAMKKKSISLTILSSFLVAGILNSNADGFTLSTIILIPICFSLIGAIVIYYAIKDIDAKDLNV